MHICTGYDIYTLLYNDLSTNRIIEVYDSVVSVLLQEVNFTDISVVTQDVVLRGERVSPYHEFNNDIAEHGVLLPIDCQK